MSIKLMSKVWENGPDDRTETMVLLALADRANDDGTQCYPSLKDIAQRCRLSRQGTVNVINRLEENEWVTVQRGGGRGNPNRYQIHSDKLEQSSSFTESEDEKGKADTINSQADSEKGKADKAKGSSSLDGNHQGTANGNHKSNRESTHAREDPVEVLKDLWGVSPTNYQADQIDNIVEEMSWWRDVLHDLKMQNKDSKKAVGWAVDNYLSREKDEIDKQDNGSSDGWDSDLLAN